MISKAISLTNIRKSLFKNNIFKKKAQCDLKSSDSESSDSDSLKKEFENLKIKESIEHFKELDLKLEKSPSDQYFLRYFKKIYSDICLNTTLELLNKIKKIDAFNSSGNDIFLITQDNVKIFLYAYIIVTNHHEIFGINSNLERNLVKSSLDMLYIFIKLCDKIYQYKVDKVEHLLKIFKDKYQKYYHYFQEWKQNDAKELLDVLTFSYYNLSHNLCNINKNDEAFNSINNQIEQVENKIQYLICDNSPDKSNVKKYISSHMTCDKLKQISNKARKSYWKIQIYNLENDINILESTQNIFKIIESKINKLSKKYNYKTDEQSDEKSPIPEFLEYIENKHLDFEIFSNKYFLNCIHYLIRYIEEIDSSNDIEKEVINKIVKNKYKKFAQEFLEKDIIKVVPKTLNEIMSSLYKL